MRIPSHLVASALVVAASGTALAGPATASTSDDLRSPDAVDAATAQTAAEQDKRSPDATDAASATPSRAGVAVTPPPRALESSSGFDWGSAAIGAGGAIGLVAVTTGAGLTLRRRHDAASSRLAAH
jgi:hypothetical protein